MIELKDYKNDPQWLSKKLGISAIEINNALDRLERLGLIARNGDHIEDLTGGKTTCLDGTTTSTARRCHQKQVLEKAIFALESVAPAKRDQTSMTLAINSDDLEAVKELTKEYRRKISNFLNKTKEDKDEVYNLSISFYPLTESL